LDVCVGVLSVLLVAIPFHKHDVRHASIAAAARSFRP
jgi:hypothetical protein